MLDAVTAVLAAIGSKGAFAAEIQRSAEDLRIRVAGVGLLRLPISPVMAGKLASVATPAPFGRRGETLVDLRVRDTGEIAAAQVSIEPQWQAALDRHVADLGDRLGLPADGKLEAVLDKLLVYGPGQFFAFHQDSERADDMVATLVVILPSRHEGGALVIEHHRQKLSLGVVPRGSRDLTLVAFYADCHHEVQPVTSGHRVTLTYQLHHRGAKTRRAPRATADRLEARISAYFATPIPSRYSNAPPQRPDRLVYLLDHEYTQRSLSWKRLKSADRPRAAALREVASRLDCEVFLALADVHESWSCEDDGWERYRGRGRRRYGDHDEDEAREEREYELYDLLDSDVELRHWVDADDEATAAIAVHPRDDEVCFTRASVEMDPFQSEHEGYMGNYGNTVDRWYHRAAVVLWPRARSFVLRAKVSPAWAVKQIKAQIAGHAAPAARARVEELLPFWGQVAGQESGERFVTDLLEVAAALDDPEIALGLLSPLGTERLSPATIPAFTALVERFGASWSIRLLTGWVERRSWAAKPWLPSLPGLCQALSAAGQQGTSVASWLLGREVATFEKRYLEVQPPAYADGAIDRWPFDDVLALLTAAAAIHADAARDHLAGSLMALPLLRAGALLQRCREARRPAEVRALGLGALYRHVVSSLEEIVAAPPRRPDDWSIALATSCRCELCRVLSKFLGARDQVEYSWPLAKEGRQHIHNAIDVRRLPVTHVTTREGRPYTLVLRKQSALFTQEEALRARQKALLSWLRKERASFGAAKE